MRRQYKDNLRLYGEHFLLSADDLALSLQETLGNGPAQFYGNSEFFCQ